MCVAPTNEMIYHSPERTKHLSHGRLQQHPPPHALSPCFVCWIPNTIYISFQHSSIWKDPTVGFREPSSFMLDVPEASLGETASDVRQVRWSISKTKMSEIQSENPQLLVWSVWSHTFESHANLETKTKSHQYFEDLWSRPSSHQFAVNFHQQCGNLRVLFASSLLPFTNHATPIPGTPFRGSTRWFFLGLADAAHITCGKFFASWIPRFWWLNLIEPPWATIFSLAISPINPIDSHCIPNDSHHPHSCFNHHFFLLRPHGTPWLFLSFPHHSHIPRTSNTALFA